MDPFHKSDVISASKMHVSAATERLVDKFAAELEKAEANYFIGYDVCCARHSLNSALDGMYDDCEDFERRPSWNIVFCENIRLPAFGWLRNADAAWSKIMALYFVHDETPHANVIVLDEGRECRIDLSGANFEFCDKYNTYALNNFRALAGWLESPHVEITFVATIAVSSNDVQVRGLSGETLQVGHLETLSLLELLPRVQFECRNLNVKLVTDTGEILHSRFFREIVLQPGMNLTAVQAVLVLSEQKSAEQREASRLDEEAAMKEAIELGYDSALRGLDNILWQKHQKSVNARKLLEALKKSEGLVHKALQMIVSQDVKRLRTK